MTPDREYLARYLRVMALRAECVALQLRLYAACLELEAALQALTDAWELAEFHEFVSHPDIQELNVMLEGFYGHHQGAHHETT